MNRPSPAPRRALLAAVALLALLVGGAAAAVPQAAQASPESGNELGFTYAIVSTGGVVTVDIRLKPTRSFDTVTVEPGSGVASLSPPCQLVSLVTGGSYGCRIEVTGTGDQPGMTVNVVGLRRSPGVPVPASEIHHFSLSNASFAPGARPRSPSQHVLPGSASHASP